MFIHYFQVIERFVFQCTSCPTLVVCGSSDLSADSWSKARLLRAGSTIRGLDEALWRPPGRCRENRKGRGRKPRYWWTDRLTTRWSKMSHIRIEKYIQIQYIYIYIICIYIYKVDQSRVCSSLHYSFQSQGHGHSLNEEETATIVRHPTERTRFEEPTLALPNGLLFLLPGRLLGSTA